MRERIRRSAARWLYSRAFVPFVLLGMTLAEFARYLFLPGDRVISLLGLDGSNLMIYSRQFGFGELRRGHVALWNPHIYSGVPFMGGFIAALFYPPNWIYLVLPLAKAFDWEVAIHVFLLGLFMSLWVGRYRLHPLAVLLASAATMFGGTVSLAIFAGHLPQLDSMTWVPLILFTLDALLDEPAAGCSLFGLLRLLAGGPYDLSGDPRHFPDGRPKLLE